MFGVCQEGQRKTVESLMVTKIGTEFFPLLRIELDVDTGQFP
jgi:hypothetical protein